MSPKHPAQPEQASIELANKREEIDRAEDVFLKAVERFKYPDAAKFALRLALEEAIVNAFRHGHKNLPPETTVRIEFKVAPDEIELAIQDQGPGFDPGTVADPTLDHNLEIPTGRGLMLMRAYMARVEYVGRGNRVEMVYRRSAG